MKLKRAPQFLNVKEVDRENYRIYFTFSTGAVDRHGEVIDQKGWKLDNYLKNPVVLWGHDQSLFPIGKAEDLGYQDGNLGGWVRFAYKENPQAAIAFELCAEGFLNAGSVGFANLKWMYDETTDTLTLLENELYEFSIVNVPANADALSKAVETLKEKNVEKRVIDGVEALRKEIEKKAEDRFKNLGEEVKDEEDAEDETETPEGGTEDVETKEPTAEDLENIENEEATDDDVKAAVETLLKAGTNKIKEAVESLTEKLKDADNKAKVETTPAQPQGRKNGGARKYSTHEINRVIRSLMRASDKH